MGGKAPSELSVSAEWGVSRGIVREAYSGLRMTGILDISNGRSPRVGELHEGVLSHLPEHALSTDQATTEQALHLRAAIEVRAAELAAENRLPDHVAALQPEAALMRANMGRHVSFAEADARFHETIGPGHREPSVQPDQQRTARGLKTTIRVGLCNRIVQSELDQVAVTHQRLAAAIGDGDAVQAREYMVIHFCEALRSFNRTHGAAAITDRSRSRKAGSSGRPRLLTRLANLQNLVDRHILELLNLPTWPGDFNYGRITLFAKPEVHTFFDNDMNPTHIDT